MIPVVDLDGLADYQRRREAHRTGVLSLIMVVLAVALSMVAQCGDIAEAQEPDVAVVLAQVCAGEAGMSQLAECAAIATVLSRRSETGTVTVSIARRYSAALRGHSRHVRPWLLELDASGDRPPSWPERLAWGRWRPMWLGLLEHARRIVAGQVEPVCRADHWGGAMDSHRAYRAGWIPVDCGRTRNRFWRVPRS